MVVLEKVREWSRSTRTAMETLGNFLERLGGSFCNVYLYARKVVRLTALCKASGGGDHDRRCNVQDL